MNSCTACEEKVSRWYVFQQTLIKKSYPFKCPNCQEEIYFTAKSLKLSLSLIPVVPVLLVLFIITDLSELISGLIVLFLTLFLLLLYPFIVELTTDEERLF